MQDGSLLKNSHVKKSSFELQDEEDTEPRPDENIHNNLPLTGQSNILSHQAEDQNLLDLQEEQNNKEEYFQFLRDRIVVIQGPELVTESVIKSYKLYRIKSRKKMEDNFDTLVSRRFSDFQYLQKQLIENYGGYIIPLLPEKNFWANVNMEGEQYMFKRVRDLEKYLRSLLAHERLRMAGEVRNFLFSDQAKFSQQKGEFFSNLKTEERIYSMAESAYNYSKGLFSRLITGSQGKEEEQLQFVKPNVEDLKLMEYEQDVSGLVKILNVLRNLVENTATEMRVIQKLQQKQSKSKGVPAYQKLLQEFQDLCKYIISCNQALKRRHEIRASIDEYNREYQALQKKIKTNPRSQDVDILRNKLAKATQKCNKWTESLLGELQKSVSLGKSMVQQFVQLYTRLKEDFYHN